MTSRCGSADVLAELGVRVDCEPALMEQALREIGICFLFAQSYHQSMKHVAPVRRELGFRTVFNMIGPLSNPAGASHQLLGVGAKPLARLLAEVLALLGTKSALVVHGSDGLDEITTTGPTFAYFVENGGVREDSLAPAQAGIETAKAEDLKGGDAPENAQILRAALNGAAGPKLDIVLLNAGAAIMVAGLAPDLAGGVELARKSVASGAALEKLERLAALTSGSALGAGR
jgi:anthranilate phosphoribosyltransferase